MAKTVGDLLIKLGVDGIEGVTQLKSALSGLSKAAGPADAGLIKLGKAIKAFNREGGASRDVIAGKLSALKSLRNQAGLNGAAFRALTKDIVDYQQKLAAADRQIDETTKKVSTLAQVSSQIPGRKAGTFGNQIAAFNEELKDLSVTSTKYATVLRNIQERTRSFQRAQARQSVIAAGQSAAQGPIDKRTAFEVTTELPRTTAALSLRLTELREDFANIAIGSKDYVNALREINSLESQIGDPFGTAARKQQIRGRLGQQEQFGMFAPRDPVQSAIARRERRRSRRYGGFAGGGMANQPVEASGLFKQIASISGAGRAAEIEMMGKSFDQVANSIRNATLASNGSINSLQAQRGAFAQLRAGLDPTSKDFRELGREIEKVDRRLEKLNKRRRRPTIGGAASALGGIAAGGIFGGPEGALGAAAGGAFGGIQGVAAGAALGAQVKMLREMLGATSEYAAQIEKLRISLRGVTKVQDNVALSQANFNAATKAAADVTRDFNVPQDVAIRGMTKLTAAVMGAEGSVADAEVVFKNVTAAIKATGGGAQDVESAITAMVQTFSKGKVSAEELSGQLGERLPGAVTQFAKANDMTLPELQKAFKAGSVGLNELMQFIISLGPKYRDIARGIADSAADAGARSLVAFNEMKIAVGEALQPIGAQLQDAFTEFVTDILPGLIKASQIAAVVINKLLDVAAFLIANFDKLASSALVLGSAIGTAGLVKAAITAGGAMNALKLALFDVRLAVAGLGKAIAFLMANPVVLLVAGITAAGVALYRAVTANDRFIKSLDDGNTTLEEAKEKTEDVYDKIGDLQERLDKTSNKRLIQSLRRQMRNLHDDVDDLNEAMERAIYREFGGGKGFVGPVIPGMKATDELPESELTKFKPPTGEDGGTGSAPMSLVELQLRRQMRDALEKENKIKQSLLQKELDLLAAAEEVEDANKRINMEEQARFDHRQRLKEILEEEKQEIENIQKPLGDLLNKYTQEIRTRERINELVKKGVNEGLAKELAKIEEIARAQKELLDEKIKYLEVQLAGLDAESEVAKQIQKQIDLYKKARKELPKQEGDAKDAATVLNKEQTFMEGLDEAIRNQEEALKKLISPLNQVKEAANAIGEAFKTSFRGIIDGSMTAKQALASFFQSIADHFADMAAEIAAEAVKLAALKFVQMIVSSMFPGAGSMGGGGQQSAAVAAGWPGNLNYAQGGYVQGGFKAFNQGGVVSQPTLGMVGEGGEPEYIIPQSKMRESMARYSRGVRGSGVIPDGGGVTAASGGGTAVAEPIDVRYTVERINSVDYVTSDQFQSGMRQAANQGAKQGEQQTLKRLQMSNSTRKRLGM